VKSAWTLAVELKFEACTCRVWLDSRINLAALLASIFPIVFETAYEQERMQMNKNGF
jgi:hypothetical protein